MNTWSAGILADISTAVHLGIVGLTKNAFAANSSGVLQLQQTPWETSGLEVSNRKHRLSQLQQHYYHPQHSNHNPNLRISHHIQLNEYLTPIDTRNDQETIPKIQELKRLLYRHPQYHSNPDVLIKCATLCSFNGDNTLLDEWLERFRTLDAISK